MPAPSRAMQQAAAIALHHPEQLYKRNQSLRSMSREQLREYASTPHKGLPEHTAKNVPIAEMMQAHRRRRKKK
jgi:hypothetical protein